MRIGDVNAGEQVLIVAEIGNNHEGDVDVALRLIDIAAEAGVQAVKFQTFRTDAFVNPRDAARLEMMRRFELSPDAFARLADAARAAGLLFISTPLDLPSVATLAPLVDAFKVASGDISFAPLLEEIAATGKPAILSTGLADEDEIAFAVAQIRMGGRAAGTSPDLGLLHCVSAYPTPLDQANLRGVATLARRFPDATPGYSDHTVGVRAATLAVAAGARIIEKHITLANDYSAFRDHQLSADPPTLRRLVAEIREAEAMLGDGVKGPGAAEAANLTPIRRSIAAARDLPAGRRLEIDDLTWLRPGEGLRPGCERLLLGKRLVAAVPAGTPLTVAMVTQG